MRSIERGLWPPGTPREVTTVDNALAVARSLKARSFYTRPRNNQKTIDLLGPRLGASLSKDRLEARVFMDRNMIQKERARSPNGNPTDLLRRFKCTLGYNCDDTKRLINLTIHCSDPIEVKDGTYAHLSLQYDDNGRSIEIIRAVLIGEVIRCIDDAIAELDMADGVYGR